MLEKVIDYKVKDFSLADWGRKEINLAEAEMPGLMSLRKEYADKKQLQWRAGIIFISLGGILVAFGI